MQSVHRCTACKCVFSNQDQQKEHYQCDWHRHNLKRKVANLTPITQAEFDERVEALAQQNKTTNKRKGSESHECVLCRKTFHSMKAFTQHEKSNKHKERVTAENKKDNNNNNNNNNHHRVNTSSNNDALPRAVHEMTEEEMVKEIEQRLDAIQERPNTDCLFCNQPHDSIKESISHMAQAHGFFIPDVEFLFDPNGLLQYFKEKICVGFICLWCNGKGRAFMSLEAVQGHMCDKAHCKIPYDTPSDWDELADYYDYTDNNHEEEDGGDDSSLSEGWESADDEELTEQEILEARRENAKPKPFIGISLDPSQEAFEVTLSNGRTLRHREMRKYYKQKLRPQDDRDAVKCYLLESYKGMELSDLNAPSQLAIRREKILQHNTQKYQHHNQAKNHHRIGAANNEVKRKFYVNRSLRWN